MARTLDVVTARALLGKRWGCRAVTDERLESMGNCASCTEGRR